MGRDFTAEEEEAIRIVAYHESRNDPSAINNRPDDVNAQIGDNSVGLMQVTRSNFARYVPGGDPYDPVDSIIAAVRYSDERYGGIDRSKGVVDYQSGAPHQNPYGESNDNYTWY
ncbi:MAG: transglycosylase SLT domain-containing protein [Archangiaceae bacterium]|nr:transglycosylase SLT domain-containing protein [Archangiaceae bacterium]